MQLSQAVQGQQTGIDQMSQVVSSVSALQQQMQAFAQNVSSVPGSSMSQAAAVGSSRTAQAHALQPADAAGAVESSSATQHTAATQFGTLFNLAGSARANPATPSIKELLISRASENLLCMMELKRPSKAFMIGKTPW